MSQYQIKEKVFCIMQGVCSVEEIVKMKQKDKTFLDYYRLVPLMEKNCTIYSPVQLESHRLRPIKSLKEYEKVLSDAEKLKSKWEVNEQKRIIKRNKAVKEDDTITLISMVRTYHRMAEHALNGNDVIWLKKAEQILVSEMSESLNITYETAAELLYRDDVK